MDPLNWVLNLNTFRGDAISLDRTLFFPVFLWKLHRRVEVEETFFYCLICECEAFYALDFHYWKHIFRAERRCAETHHCCLILRLGPTMATVVLRS